MAQAGHGRGAILSPTHLSPSSLRETADSFRATGKDLLFDPQMFDPRNLPQREGEPAPDLAQTHDLSDINNAVATIDYYFRWQEELNVSSYLVPCPTASPFTREWIRVISRLNEQAYIWAAQNDPNRPRFSTIILPEDVLATEDTRHELLNSIVGFDTFNIEGFYVVFEAQTLMTNVDALCGMLDFVFRLKQNQYSVLLGFADFWAMLAFPFGLDGFAGGSWQRSRAFQANQWRGEQPRGPRRRAKRYRSSVLLADIRFPEEAELLREVGMWSELNNSSPYASGLFSGASPATIESSNGWREGISHQNTFWQFISMTDEFQPKTREERILAVRSRLNTAEEFFSRAARNRRQLQNNGSHLSIWRTAFERYLFEVYDELVDEFE